MPLINLSIQHGQTVDVARQRLQMAVTEVQHKFGPLIQRTEWTVDRNAVKLAGAGFEIDMRVDAQAVHVVGDIPLLGRLLGTPVIQGLRGALERTFQKKLPE